MSNLVVLFTDVTGQAGAYLAELLPTKAYVMRTFGPLQSSD